MASKRNARVGLLATILILLLFALWAIVQFILLPRISTAWQSILLVGAAALLSIATLLAAIVQLTGYSLRDFRLGPPSPTSSADEISRLVSAIRSSLYADDSSLLGVLSQVLELCDRCDLHDERLWIRKELAGFGGYEQLEAELGSTEAVESWMKAWASHRLVNTYFRVGFTSERGSYEVDEWPYEQIFVAVPVQSIIDDIRTAKANHVDELSVRLVRLDRDRLHDLRTRLAQTAPGIEAPQDLQLYTRRAEYEKMLFGVRDRVSQLLTQLAQRG